LNQKNINTLLINDKNLIKQGIVKIENDICILNSKYKIGQLDVKKNIAILQISTIEKIFIELDKLQGAYTNDTVLVQRIFNSRIKAKAKVIKIIQRGDNKILCSVNNSKLYSIKENINIKTKLNIKKFKDGDILLISQDKIVKIFGNISDSMLDEKISLYLYNEEYRQKEYKTLIEDEFKISKRLDLTHLSFCTIDPTSAKDHDDAIYFDENTNELYVAIADVSAFIKEGSALDIEARKRAFSIYLPNKVLPMLPFSLSSNLCSLKVNEKRFAYVFKMKLDMQTLEIIYSDIFEATIISKNKYSYEQVDNILNNDEKEYKQIIQLYTITKKLRIKRLKNGFDFKTEELRLKLNNEEKLKTISIELPSASHELIEECMLLANCEAAKKLKGIGIFRIHDAPTDKKIEKLIDDVLMLGLNVKTKNNLHQTIENIQKKAKNIGLKREIDKLIIQSQQQARYDSKSLGHFGLGFSDYSHFTSPIRRYSDLVLHRILKTKQIPKDINSLCEDISNKERGIAYLVWDLEDRKYARWAFENINVQCEAVIVDVDKKIVKLTNQMIGARMICEGVNGLKLFTHIKLRIVTSDRLNKTIMAKII
jgi:ribonuclease R